MAHVDPQKVLQQFVTAAGSRSAAAEELGVTRQMVAYLLSGERQFSDDMLSKLGLVRDCVIRRAQGRKGA